MNKRLLNVAEKVFLEWFLFVSRAWSNKTLVLYSFYGTRDGLLGTNGFVCSSFKKSEKEPRRFFSIYSNS